MATKPRGRSACDLYHVFQRGVNHFDIFEDDADRRFYLDLLQHYASECGAKLHAWCLMSNHTHLLVEAGLEELSRMMQMIGSRYARFFNGRHVRSGPLFEGRFCSVCVETESQAMCVVRYIHRNPVHHEQAALLGEYPWSSYREYMSAAPTICDVEFVLSLFGGIDEFESFHESRDDRERHLDIGALGRMRDDEARVRADQALVDGGFDVAVTHIGTLPRKLRDNAIACVKRAVGCSMRQMQRLTALAYSAIRGAVAADGGETISADVDFEPVESGPQELAAALGGFKGLMIKAGKATSNIGRQVAPAP